MSVKQWFAVLLLNLFAGALLGALLLSVIAFLVAGWEGVVNGLLFGAAFGTLAGIGASTYVGYSFWEGFARRLGASRNRER
jgi:hypothetical protein